MTDHTFTPAQPMRETIYAAAKEGNLEYWRASARQRSAFDAWVAGGCEGNCPRECDGSIVDYITNAVHAALSSQPPAAPVDTYSDCYTQENIEILESENRRLKAEIERLSRSSAETASAGPCLNCGRKYAEHSFDTRDICNFYLGGSDDVRRTMPDRSVDCGGAGQGGVVFGDAAGQEDLRGATASSLRGDREVTIGQLPDQPQRAPEQKDKT